MMQWVTYVSLGLVLIVSTTHGEEDAIVDDVANSEYVHCYQLEIGIKLFC
jgi:hypothetical protein